MSAAYDDMPPILDENGEPIDGVVLSKERPQVAKGDLPKIAHVNDFRAAIVTELRLRAQLGDDAAGGELLGFTELDNELNVEAGRLFYVGARDGIGKTAWALQTARTIALRKDATGQPGTVLYVMTEMAEKQTVLRVIASFAQLEASRLRRGVTDETVAAVERAFDLLSASGLHIVNASGRNVNEIATIALAFRAEHPDLRAVFVDNLTGIEPATVKRSQGSHEYIGEIVRRLNSLAFPDQLNCPIFAIGHLARPERGQAGKPPTKLDIAGSDQVNRWADTILLLHRVEGDDRDPMTPVLGHRIEVHVPKNRDGREFICELEFRGRELRFVDPHGPTVRPYELPKAEPAARSEFRRLMAEFDAL